MEPYYYQQMDKASQKAYHSMKTGIEALADHFLVPKLDPRTLSDIFFKLRLDHPEIFYVTGFKYRAYVDSPNIEMIPEYLFDKSKIKEHQKAMTARVDKLVRGAKDLKELEKELYIHDFICNNVKYDKLKKPYSHEIIGPLGHGVGVCEGIAKSVKILCDHLNIWCIIVISEANPEKKIKYRHAWNIIRIDGKYYHLDVTFDNTISKDFIRYDYFNLPDLSVFRDHEPIMTKFPNCDEGHSFYYYTKKLSFTKMEDVEKRVLQAVKKGKTFTFHWRGSYLTKDVLAQLMTLFEKCGKTKNKAPYVRLNWPQAVLSVHFDDAIKETIFAMDEANEGEQES